MSALRWFYQLSWKKIFGAGVTLLLLAAVPLSLKIANEQTRTRSQAALIHPSPEAVTVKFETPKGAPKIYLVDHFFGKAGDSVLIHGENLGGVHPQTAVYLGGQKIAEENLVTWTGSYIEFKVPQGAKSGPVRVDILGKTAEWPGTFFVTASGAEAEITLEKNSADPNTASLTLSGAFAAKDMLVWLLVINSESALKFSQTTAGITQFTTPLGRVYELKFSSVKNGLLAQISKPKDSQVGIARTEITLPDGTLFPAKSHPLSVSF
jgi:hypothetical protein